MKMDVWECEGSMVSERDVQKQLGGMVGEWDVQEKVGSMVGEWEEVPMPPPRGDEGEESDTDGHERCMKEKDNTSFSA